MTQEEVKALSPGQLIECRGAFETAVLEVHRVIKIERDKRLGPHFRPIIKKPGSVIADEAFAITWPPEDILRVVNKED